MILAILISLPLVAQAEQLTPLENSDAESIYPINLKTAEGFEYGLTHEQLDQLLRIHKSSTLDSTYKAEIERSKKCLDHTIHCDFLVSTRDTRAWKIRNTLELQESVAHTILLDISHQIQKEPKAAHINIQNGKATEFTPGEIGLSLPIDTNLSLLRQELPKKTTSILSSFETLSLVTEEILPPYTSPEIEQYGIFSLLGEGKTNFYGSSRDRIFNIQRAADQFNGHILPPDEELSFVGILGPVEEETGYRAELVIRNNKTEPEYGGGICQVSTTLFRAAIYSGLKISQRQNHSYPVKYYAPTGFDATIFVPNPDLRFINNTQHHILIQTRIEGSEFIVQLYGTDDKRNVDVLGPEIVAKKNPNEYLRTELTQIVRDTNDNIIIEDIFASSYNDPKDYPNPNDTLMEKPDSWSKSEWKDYKNENGL